MHTKQGHERSVTKTIRKWKAARERRDRYTIECYQSLHARWITSFYDYMQNNRQIVLNGWEKLGITKFLKIYAALNQTGVDLVTLPIIVWLGCRSTPYIDIIMFFLWFIEILMLHTKNCLLFSRRDSLYFIDFDQFCCLDQQLGARV